MLAVPASPLEADALRSERTQMKLSSGTQEHKGVLRGLVVEVRRERYMCFVNAIVARSRFFFFRSRERGEIKSDCSH